MNYKKLIGWGILIYLVNFLIVFSFKNLFLIMSDGLVRWTIKESLLTAIISLIAFSGMAFLVGRSLHANSVISILKYSIGWVLIVGILRVLPFIGYSNQLTIKEILLLLFVPLQNGLLAYLLIPLLTIKKVKL